MGASKQSSRARRSQPENPRKRQSLVDMAGNREVRNSDSVSSKGFREDLPPPIPPRAELSFRWELLARIIEIWSRPDSGWPSRQAYFQEVRRIRQELLQSTGGIGMETVHESLEDADQTNNDAAI